MKTTPICAGTYGGTYAVRVNHRDVIVMARNEKEAARKAVLLKVLQRKEVISHG